MAPTQPVPWGRALLHWARRHRRRLGLTAAAALMCVVSVGLMRVQRQLTIIDARLGADIVVAAAGMSAEARQPLLMDLPQRRAIDAATLAAIQRTPGVALTVPLYNLGKLSAHECPSCAFGFSPQFVGIDPQAAFNIWPWWQDGAALPLTDQTLIAGWDMPTYLLNADWSMFGHAFTVAGILQPTGTHLDNTMLLTMGAARQLAKIRTAWQAGTKVQQAEHAHLTPPLAAQRIGDPGDGVSTVLIRARDDTEPQAVATQLALQGWDLDVAVAPAYVTALRRHLGQSRRMTGTMGTAMLILAVLVGLVAWLPTAVRGKLPLIPWRRARPKTSATRTT